MKKAVVLVLLSLATGASANQIIRPDGGSDTGTLFGGSGNQQCQAYCVSVCGRGGMSDEVITIEKVYALGETKTKALNNAVALCQTSQNILSCPLNGVVKGESFGVARKTVKSYEIGLRKLQISKDHTYLGEFLRNSTQLNEENCAQKID